MKALENKIINEGKVVSEDILKVGGFLNQQIDTRFMFEMGREIADLFKDAKINKIVTIEASGIAIAMAAAYYIDVPMVFAKKNKSNNVAHDVYSAPVKSFTHGKTYEICVSSEYINKEDNILIIDDFLAEGNAVDGLCTIIKKAGAEVAGVAVAIEKGFQNGGKRLREKGIRLESLAIIDEMSENYIKFRQ